MPELAFNAVTGEVVVDCVYEFSMFKNLADRSPETVGLEEFAEMVAGGEWFHEVSNVREAKDKAARSAAKKLLPCVTVSGIFSGGHHSSNLVQHSGLICMDFDLDSNPFLADRVEEFRETLEQDQFVKLAFASASGQGLAVICRIEPDRHGEAFDALSEWFRQSYGLKADKGCRDITRLRFASWDDNAEVSEKARLFKRYSMAGSLPNQPGEFGGFGSSAPVEAAPTAVTLSRERRQEIADCLGSLCPDTRDNWLMAGQAIHSECSGQDGFNLWREWSELNDSAAKFDESDCFRVWKSFRGSGINIETLFKMGYESGWNGPPPLPVTELPTVSGGDWLAQKEAVRKPLILDLIDEGEMGECIAPSKTRKSFFMLQLAICLAAGRKFLDFETARRARVLVVNMELTPEWQHRRMLKMAEAMNISRDEVAELHFANTRGLDVANMPDAIIQTAKVLRPALIIVDPLYFLHDGDENAAKDMMPVVRNFLHMMKETGAAMIMVHHDAKGKAGDRNIRDRGAGSSVFGRACDSRIVLTPHAESADHVCVETMARNFKPREPFTAVFDGFFEVDDDADFEPETSKTTRKTKSEKEVLEFAELSEQAAGYLEHNVMRTGEFRDKVLKQNMGLGVKAAKRLLAYMKKEGDFLSTKQHKGGYWISTNERLIDEKNDEIDREKNRK